MDLKTNRKNILEYLKEFRKIIPKRTSIFSRSDKVDTSKLENIRDEIEMFYERGTLCSPMLIDKNNIDAYLEDVSLVKQFPGELSPEKVMESEIFKQTENARSSRIILLPSIVEENSHIMESYNKMIAYYLLMGGDKPVEIFSKVEMAMKKYGVTSDLRHGCNEIWR